MSAGRDTHSAEYLREMWDLRVETNREARKRLLPLLNGPFWWRYDSGRACYVQRFSGEELRLVGKLNDVGTGEDGDWYLFEYVGEDCVYPLMIEAKRRYGFAMAQYRESFAGIGGQEWQIWRVDHNRSSERWREGNPEQEHPPYWLWRRADEAIIGAALSLPLVDVLGPPVEMIVSDGGWLNGQWRSSMFRQMTMPFAWPGLDLTSKFATFGQDGQPRPDDQACFYTPWTPSLQVRRDEQPHIWVQDEIEREVFTPSGRWGDRTISHLRLNCMREVSTGAIMRRASMSYSYERGIDAYDGLSIEHGEYIVIASMNRSNWGLFGPDYYATMPGEILSIGKCRFVEPVSLPQLERTFLIGEEYPHFKAPSEPTVTPYVVWEFPILHKRLMRAYEDGIPFSRGFDIASKPSLCPFGDYSDVQTYYSINGYELMRATVRLRMRLPGQPEELSWEPYFK